MKGSMHRLCVAAVFLLLALGRSEGQDVREMILNLKGGWKFAIGDNARWKEPSFSDSDWEVISVPAKWEDQGFYGYNGHAWYRKTFDGTALKNPNWSFELFLGYIDDVDEVYLNGHRVGGSGTFPPRYQTAYNASRKYHLPGEYVNFQGKNVLAIRVYDAEQQGGIVSGQVGIFANRDDENLAINLRGIWEIKLNGREGNFHKEFDKAYLTGLRQEDEGKNAWKTITVPDVWEHQGFNYDGTAWYRKTFVVPGDLTGEDMVLMLGKIDDNDQTYLNEKLIGASNGHDKLRIYHVTADMLKPGTNTLLVYVTDSQGYGGIYDSPVGFIKQSAFTRYFRWRK